MGMALLVAWAAHAVGLPAKHAKSALGKQLLARTITPRAFFTQACGTELSTSDVHATLKPFLYGYTHRLFLGDDFGSAKPIQKLLRLHRADERAFSDDYLGTFKKALKSPYLVPDSWQALARLAPVLDARWADYRKTKFKKAPDLALYENAATLRDAQKLAVSTARVVTAQVDPGLGDALIASVGQRIKAVKTTLEAAGLPLGKKVDEQGNAALGVSYMGVKTKGQMTVDSVTFYANKYTRHIRGAGAELQFKAWPGALPKVFKGIALGDSRDAVRAALGKPTQSPGDFDWFTVRPNRRITACFGRGKLVLVELGLVTRG